MYQPDSGAAKAKKIGGLILVVVVGGLAAGVAKVGTREVISFFQTSPSAVEGHIQKSIRENPQYAPLYDELKADFPADYQRLLTTFSDAARGGQSSDEIGQIGRAFMQDFVKGQAPNVARAPEAALLSARDAHIKVIEILADESPYMCAQFSTTGLTSQPSRDAQFALGSAAALTIRAAALGRDEPVQRPDPIESDWVKLVDSMRAQGVPEADLEHMGNQTMSSMPVDAQCALGLALYRALKEVPRDTAARLSAAILVPAS